MNKIGILNPGEMGVSVAASAINSGHQVFWTSQGRSHKTRLRAQKHNLIEIETLSELCQTSEMIFSVCPPHAAEEVARAVLATGFKGFYLDANAISQGRSIRIGELMEGNGIHFVDGGIIGGPAWTANETWLYLAGKDADHVANCFAKGPLETKIIGNETGRASALKMCYAAYSKGTTALLSAVLATADSLDVREELYHQWDRDDEGFSEQINRRVRRVTAKAWRFEGEMKEIASTFREAGMPDGFHEAAAEIYQRMAGFKERPENPPLNEVLKTLLER